MHWFIKRFIGASPVNRRDKYSNDLDGLKCSWTFSHGAANLAYSDHQRESKVDVAAEHFIDFGDDLKTTMHCMYQSQEIPVCLSNLV